MTILIYGHNHDEHALAVRHALMSEGHECAVMCSDEFPVAATVSIVPVEGRWRFRGPLIDHDVAAFDTVWNRRNKPAADMPDLHPDDRAVARAESTRFLRELRLTVPSEGQIWVNPEPCQRAIAAKPAQLALAHAVGLTIPATLISNDPDEVRRFVGAAPQAIVKALDKILWEDEAGQVVLPTTGVALDDCDDDVAIRACPMIYQHRIDKQYELRVVVFGDELLAVRLDSQRVEAGRLDWRAAPPSSFPIHEVKLPDGMAHRLRAFCRQAGVLHGSFDLAVTPGGEIVFFEFNPQGQSLWIEDWNPDIRVLDRLVQFLLNPVRAFRYHATGRHAFGDYLAREATGAPPDAMPGGRI